MQVVNTKRGRPRRTAELSVASTRRALPGRVAVDWDHHTPTRKGKHMANDAFAGDPEAMGAAARDFAAALGDLDGFVRPVREGAGSLPWSGRAADRYRQLLLDWLGQFDGICRALETMQTALVGTASGYGDSEEWAMQAVGAAGGGSGAGPTARQQALGMR
jgi:uncharacterized protein YukE